MPSFLYFYGQYWPTGHKNYWMSNQTSIRFNTTSRQFYIQNLKRVDSYFKENKLSKVTWTCTWNSLHVRMLFWFLWINCWPCVWKQTYLATVGRAMGFHLPALAFCVMHDANHGSYSKTKPWTVFLVFFSMNVIGGYAINWRIQHNVLHHTYTNIHEHDEDIALPACFGSNLTHNSKVHKLQFIYARFLYGIMTLMWSTTKKTSGNWNVTTTLDSLRALTPSSERKFFLIFSKLFYYAYMLLPLFLIPEMTVLTGFADFNYALHGRARTGAYFSTGSRCRGNGVPFAWRKRKPENHWAVHQLHTTMNFATRDPIFTGLLVDWTSVLSIIYSQPSAMCTTLKSRK